MNNYITENTVDIIKKNLLSMLHNRHIDISNIVYKQGCMYIPNQIYVRFLLKQSVKPVDIKHELEKLKEFENEKLIFPQLILILLKKPNNSILKLIKTYRSKYEIQIFLKNELMIDKVKHTLVPEHILINNPDEIKDILQKFQLSSIYKLPFILKTDPIVKYYNAKSGDIFKIIRNSNTSGKYITYRCVYHNH